MQKIDLICKNWRNLRFLTLTGFQARVENLEAMIQSTFEQHFNMPTFAPEQELTVVEN